MEMSIVNNVKTFLPIILFSIVLPLIDIVTDLRLIIRLSTYKDEYNVTWSERSKFNSSDDLSTYCHRHSIPNSIFATLLLGA